MSLEVLETPRPAFSRQVYDDAITRNLNVRHTKEYKNGIQFKTCAMCNIEKTIFKFPVAQEDHKYYWLLPYCRRCKVVKERQNLERCSPEEQTRRQDKFKARQKRYGYKYQHSVVLGNCRQVDAKKGRVCDLDIGTVKSLIALPCAYCQRTNLPRGLDRVDNSLGHTKVNVVPSCGLCNYLRHDMPDYIWSKVVPILVPYILAGVLDHCNGSRFKVQA